jgi:hypothetical protein
MITLSKEIAEKVENDLNSIMHTNKNKIFPKSITYPEFINLLGTHGLSEVANYYGFPMESSSVLFAIDSEEDLQIILSYWLVRYGDSVEVDVSDLIEKMHEEYMTQLFPMEDPIKSCILGKKYITSEDYRELSVDDRNALKKEIEGDENILMISDHIFFIND